MTTDNSAEVREAQIICQLQDIVDEYRARIAKTIDSLKLYFAKQHADKLAEAGDRLKNAVSDLINEPRTLEIEHYAESALHEWQSALAAYEEAKQ